MIPCKDCLIFPGCKQKETIHCSILMTWYTARSFESLGLDYWYQEIKKRATIIEKILPKCRKVEGD